MFALHAKSTETHQQAISFLLGQKRCVQIHSDNSSEIMNAAANLGIPRSHAESGVPETNSVAERANADVLEGAQTQLVQAGMPACFGPSSAECYCVNEKHQPRLRRKIEIHEIP